MDDIKALLQAIGMEEEPSKTAIGAGLGAKIGGGLGAAGGAAQGATAQLGGELKNLSALKKFLMRSGLAGYGGVTRGIKYGVPATALGALIGGGQDLGDYLSE